MAAAQTPFREGKNWFDKRAVKADSFRAEPEPINHAIQDFRKAIDNNDQPEKAAQYLLRSYYFKGMFLGLDKKQQRKVYDQGKQLGERMMDRFPKSVPIKFWYAANTGRWADVHGFVAAATSGIAGKLRTVCKEIIKLDSTYQGGGGYRVLAQVHFHSPNIPLVMGWPSDRKALEFAEKALNIATTYPTNLLLYAQILLKFDREDEAKTYLNNVLTLEPSPESLVEDRYVQYRARKLMEKHFANSL